MTKGIESSREPLVPPQVELEAFASSVLSLELQLLEQHKGAIGGEPGLQRAHRVIHMAPALAEGNVGIDYYAGYLLHRIYAHSSDKLIGGPTRRAIGLYIGILEDQPDKLKRVFGSISDFEEIEKTANIHRTQIQTQDKTVRGLLDGTYKGVIPEDTWKAKVP